MLLDVLGILIGFVSVILLLSLIVTALVQATQSFLRLRTRALRFAVHRLPALLHHEGLDTDPGRSPEDVIRIKREPPATADDTAEDDQPQTETAAARREPAGAFQKAWHWLRGEPGLTWVDEGDVQTLLAEDQKKRLESRRQQQQVGREAIRVRLNRATARMDGLAESRFLLAIRYATVAWALLVAAYFQVSAPELLIRLSENPQLRARAVAEAESILAVADQVIQQQKTYQDISDVALERLQERHPQLGLALEEASGIGQSREAIVRELREVLDQEPGDHGPVIAEYEEILDELYQQNIESSLSMTASLTEQLALFDIRPWRDSWDFYYDSHSGLQISRIIGVVLTAVLLTFGAPFWYERLREMAKLRDAFDPRSRRANRPAPVPTPPTDEA